MPLYSGLVKMLSLPFYLPNQWRSLFSLSWLAGLRCASQWQVISVRADELTVLWLASANNRVSASDTVSRLELELRQTSLLRCNRLVSVQTGLKRERDNKRNKTQAGANGSSESHATANVSLLVQKLSTATLRKSNKNNNYTFKILSMWPRPVCCHLWLVCTLQLLGYAYNYHIDLSAKTSQKITRVQLVTTSGSWKSSEQFSWVISFF